MQIIEQTTTKLEKVPQAVRDEIAAAEKSQSVHQSYMQLPCMNAVERGGEGSLPTLPVDFRVMAWNVERCLDIKGSAKLLQFYDPDIILLSEMDNGMSRTQQKHTTKKLAKRLGMYYLYGVEFLELSLGEGAELELAEDDFNRKGFHGNAILSKMPIQKSAMLRFDNHGHWFGGQTVGKHSGQPRVGGRMALFAQVHTDNGKPLTVISTHFESNADVVYRDKQMFDLLTACEAFCDSGEAVIVGGDLNTGNNLAKGLDHTAETLFETAEANGFHWQANPEGTTTRQSRINLHEQRLKKLDWFCAKHIDSHFTRIIPALDNEGTPLSDHDIILADWSYT